MLAEQTRASEDHGPWEADHVYSHCLGGQHTISNYLPAHPICNNCFTAQKNFNGFSRWVCVFVQKLSLKNESASKRLASSFGLIIVGLKGNDLISKVNK